MLTFQLHHLQLQLQRFCHSSPQQLLQQASRSLTSKGAFWFSYDYIKLLIQQKKYTVYSLEVFVLLIMCNIYLLEIKREMQNYKIRVFAFFLFHIYCIFLWKLVITKYSMPIALIRKLVISKLTLKALFNQNRRFYCQTMLDI